MTKIKNKMKKKEQKRQDIIQYINMKLVALGFDPVIKKVSKITEVKYAY